jgi:hypothetical protein
LTRIALASICLIASTARDGERGTKKQGALRRFSELGEPGAPGVEQPDREHEIE